jgi:hypothetical protein
LSPSTIACEFDEATDQYRQYHRQLQQFIVKNVFLHSCSKNQLALQEQVSRLPQSVRFEWKNLLTSCTIAEQMTGGIDVDGQFRTLDDIRELRQSGTDVVVVGDDHANKLGIARGSATTVVEDIELLRSSMTILSKKVATIAQVVRSGTDRQYVWDLYFKKLLMQPQPITIVDRYFLNKISSSESGSRWFLSQLAELRRGSQHRVTVVCELPEPEDLKQRRTTVQKICAGLKIRVVCPQHNFFSSQLHQRYIRVGSHLVLFLDPGFDNLAERLRRELTVSVTKDPRDVMRMKEIDSRVLATRSFSLYENTLCMRVEG